MTIGTIVPRARAAAVAERGRSMALVLGGILVVGFVLRAWSLGEIGFNSDEAVYVGQASALAGDPVYGRLFAVFRAHPLAVQFLFGIAFHVARGEVPARLVAVAFGLAAVALTYLLGHRLYGRRVGLVAAALMAVMPYSVVVSRQALLDAPMATFFLLTMYCTARYAEHSHARWLYATAFAAGMTFLAKETGVLVVAAVAAFVMLTPTVRMSARRLLIAFLLYVVAISPYPAAILIGGGSNAAQQFLLWQVLRAPNHPWTFYAEILPGAVGPLVMLAAAIGIYVALRRRGWQERLLLAWVATPTLFFELWPVKGYQYLLPIAPGLALLATQGMAQAWSWWRRSRMWDRIVARLRDPRLERGVASGALAIVMASLAIPSIGLVTSGSALGSLAGTGGLPGGREAGEWIRDNVPESATFMTIGPTMSNLIQYYGLRHSLALSVSPNPLKRNPAYEAVQNPDRSIRDLSIQYIAFDIWSAERSPYFAGILQRYITKYHGRLIFRQSALTRLSDGSTGQQFVVQIYEVRP
jgi:hypothetical protein